MPTVVEVVLETLPRRLVPSRGVLSACVELVAALADAWSAAYAAAPRDVWANVSGRLRENLDGLVGRDCSQAWWEDAAERAASASDGHRGTMHNLLVFRMQRGIAREATANERRLPSVAEEAEAGDATSEAAIDFGANWVLCAMDDVVGSVASYVARKAASAKARPATPGSRPASRQGTAGASSSGSVSQRPATSSRPMTPASARGVATVAERLHIVALKHVIAAVKGDQGLHACPVLETCLVEVATGVMPHVDSGSLMRVAAFRERLHTWAQQESAAGRATFELAIAQAMKSTAAPAPSGRGAWSATPVTTPGAKSAAKEGVPIVNERPPSSRPSSAGQGWLPKAFVREFNAEGEEVEPGLSDSEPEVQVQAPSDPTGPGLAQDASNATDASKQTGGVPGESGRDLPRNEVVSCIGSSGGQGRGHGKAKFAAPSRRSGPADFCGGPSSHRSRAGVRSKVAFGEEARVLN